MAAIVAMPPSALIARPYQTLPTSTLIAQPCQTIAYRPAYSVALEDPEGADLEPGVGHTARWTAAMRAIENERPDALFTDNLAAILAGPESVRQWKAEMDACITQQPLSRSHIAIRCRALDDLIAQELGNMLLSPTDTVQVVSIGAGLCTRPWRLPIPQAKWFEVDRPDSIRYKTRIISKQQITPSVGSYVAIGVDFADQNYSLSQSLKAHGFNARLPTLFVMEGVLCYLDVPDLEDMASEIQELMGTGHMRIIMTCINDGFLNELLTVPDHAARNTPDEMKSSTMFKSCWESGCKQVFEEAGWRVKTLVSREEYGLKKLNVAMLHFGFPDPRTSTEYIIVLERKPPQGEARVRLAENTQPLFSVPRNNLTCYRVTRTFVIR